MLGQQRQLPGTTSSWAAGGLHNGCCRPKLCSQHHGHYVLNYSPPAGLGYIYEASAGEESTCAVNKTNHAVCWTGDYMSDTQVEPGMWSMSAGAYYACGLKTNGTVVCIGDMYDGETARVPANLGRVVLVLSSKYQTCAMTPNPPGVCVREPTYSRKLSWHVEASNLPYTHPASSVLHPLVNYPHWCQSYCSNTALCWPSIFAGRLAVRCWGQNDLGQNNVPSDLGAVQSISVGAKHSCVVTAASTVRCWSVANDTVGRTAVPGTLGTVTSVFAGSGDHTCAVQTTNGSLVCWGGTNTNGQLNVPIKLGVVKAAAVGINHTCALNATGGVVCWGSNWGGQVGWLARISMFVTPHIHHVCLQLWLCTLMGMSLSGG